MDLSNVVTVCRDLTEADLIARAPSCCEEVVRNDICRLRISNSVDITRLECVEGALLTVMMLVTLRIDFVLRVSSVLVTRVVPMEYV